MSYCKLLWIKYKLNIKALEMFVSSSWTCLEYFRNIWAAISESVPSDVSIEDSDQPVH